MTETASADEGARPGLYKTVVSIVAGGIGEGVDRLLNVADRLEESEDDGDSLGPISVDPNLMALVGFASELPDIGRNAGRTVERMAYPMVRAVGVTADTVGYLLEITGIKAFWADLSEPARSAIADELERLSHIGTAEYARGRVLAAYAFEDSVGGIVELLSDSDEVAELVREQTLGVTGAAVQEVRETGAAADALTEGIFRRLLRRDARPLPPRPAEAP